MYQRIRVSQQTQHNQRPDQTNIILDQIAQQRTGGEQRFLQSHEGPDLAATSDLEKFCCSSVERFPNPREGGEPRNPFLPPCSPFTEEKGGGS